MWTNVGIFPSPTSAKQAVEELLQVGTARESIVFLSPETGAQPEEKVENVPTTDTERYGMGKTIGALLGGTVGASAGFGGGAAIAASLLVPGVGAIFAIGVGAAALLGLGGAVAGAKLGDQSEHALDTGPAKDDIALYRGLLLRGRSLVIANVESEELAKKAQEIFQRAGSEDYAAAMREIKAA
jgi:hypothetical protein